MYDQGALASLIKLNNLFNMHFPSLFFSKVFCRVRAFEVEVECLRYKDGY